MTAITVQETGREPIELYWMPGCSSCLRMKEFVEKTGLPFTAINVDSDERAARKLKDKGMRVPAMCVGDECVNGIHLATVAKALGVPYEPEGKVRISTIDVHDYQEISDRFDIASLPTLIFFEGGRQVKRLSGVKRRPQLEREFADLLGETPQ